MIVVVDIATGKIEWVLKVYETMVRAEVECIYEPVGGELVKGVESLIFMTFLIIITSIGVTRHYGYKRKKIQVSFSIFFSKSM